jgi:hypothetical protein
MASSMAGMHSADAVALEREHGFAGGARPAEELSATTGAVRTGRRARAPAAAAVMAR